MKLEKIYEILKSDIFSFEEVDGNKEKTFVYADDVCLTISISNINRENREYSFKHFFISLNKDKIVDDEYEKFVQEICKIDNFRTCAEKIFVVEITVKYNNIRLYTLNCFNIYNPSSIDFIIPVELDIYDYESNIIKLFNKHSKAIKINSAMSIIEENITIKEK